MTGGSNSFQTTAEDINAVATDFISDGIVGAVTATSGVAPTTGGLSVNAQGTPDRTTAIGAGIAYVTATPTSQASQRLRVQISAQNLTHATNTTGGTRFDWIYVKVDAALAANPVLAGDTTGTIVISRSTSSSTDNGTPPTYGYHIATVTLTNGYATIVNGNIADTRVQTGLIANSATGTVGTISSKVLTNPYKFSVYRAAALTPGAAMIIFDTKEFDTGTNYSTVDGKFTAPIAGFYQFNASIQATFTAANTGIAISLIKNGTVVKTGSIFVVMYAGVYNDGVNISTILQLAAGDYIQVQESASSGKPLVTGAANTWFNGFLVSAT